MENQLSYASLIPHVRIMRMLGFYQLDTKAPKVYRIMHYIYMRLILSLFVLYCIQQFLKLLEVRDDADKVMSTMFLFLTYTDCIFKAVVVMMKTDEIEELFDVMKGSLYNQGDPEHRPILLEAGRQALIVLRTFNYMCIITCCLWVLHPTIKHIQGKIIEFPVWLPFEYNSNPRYYFAALYIITQTTWEGYANSTIDVLIVFLLVQCKAQISIIRVELQSLVLRSQEEAMELSSDFVSIAERRIKKILIHHSQIVKMAEKIQDIFGYAVFYQLLVAGWILCTSAYRMASVTPVSVEFLSMLMYISCILLQVFIYCYFGSEVTYESEILTGSVYSMNWLDLPVKLRRTIIIFMERIKRPITPMACYIVPFSNATFVSIVRSSYTFYAFLKNSN
ncbi:odorant receptor 94a-like [Achroia grisella]|uniref:odorant receptor 94a-like n=1 Tax=Achroia grisella TaxID=688607 RepID=UPI0027D29820|nr:odorant receptor 94a-like [Achroia grisella]